MASENDSKAYVLQMITNGDNDVDYDDNDHHHFRDDDDDDIDHADDHGKYLEWTKTKMTGIFPCMERVKTTLRTSGKSYSTSTETSVLQSAQR